MDISAELTLYPLGTDYHAEIGAFLKRLRTREDLRICVGSMSTVIAGEYDVVMRALQEDCLQVFAAGAAAFVIKLSNACPL